MGKGGHPNSGLFLCADTVGKNAQMIQNPLEEDLTNDQLTLKEHMDPFTGSNREQAKENSRFKRLPVIEMR